MKLLQRLQQQLYQLGGGGRAALTANSTETEGKVETLEFYLCC